MTTPAACVATKAEFTIGDKVAFKDYPTIKGTVKGIIPADEDSPEYLSVDMFIVGGEPGFSVTGVIENFWCLPSELSSLTMDGSVTDMETQLSDAGFGSAGIL